MSIELTKPWIELDEEAVIALPGQLGVFEIADDSRQTRYIGFAGARSLFGLRSELMRWLGKGSFFRIEVTTAYRTRHRELLMAHHRREGHYPADNSESETSELGRLS